jgi:hypothetical protein
LKEGRLNGMTLIRRPSRIAVLIACFAALVLWIAFDGSDRSAPAAPAQVAAGSDTAASAVAGKPVALPARSALEKFVADPFSSHSWLPPRPKSAAVVNSAPVAPPLPYRFAGQLLLGSGMQVFLARGDEITPAKEGDTLDGQYRVESVSPTNMTLVHIATNTRQVMEFDAIKDPEMAIAPASGAGASSASSAPAAIKTADADKAPADSQAKPGAQPAQLRWDGPPSAKTGASFNVALRVTSGEQIRSAPMMVRFDPAVLESVSVRPGRYFGAEASGNFGYRVNPDGSIFVGASSRKSAPTSDAELLVLTFKPIKPAASSEVTVASLNLQGAAGHTIAYGSVTPFKTTITP